MPRSFQKCFVCSKKGRDFFTISLKNNKTGQILDRHFCSQECTFTIFPDAQEKIIEENLPTEEGKNCQFCSKPAHNCTVYQVVGQEKGEELACNSCGVERQIHLDNRLINGEILCETCNKIIKIKSEKEIMGTMHLKSKGGLPYTYYFCTAECRQCFISGKK